MSQLLKNYVKLVPVITVLSTLVLTEYACAQQRTSTSSSPPSTTPTIGETATVTGLCGTANALPEFSAPTTHLCKTGTASSMSGAGPWTWACAGQNGGGTVSCSTPLATGHQYYVSASGNDSNAGTSASPWKTIKRAASTAVAGDRVNIGTGTYYESVTLTKSGQSAAPITFAASPGATATINGAGVSVPDFTSGLINVNASNIVIDGINFAESPGTGVTIGSNVSNVVVANSQFNSSFAWGAIDVWGPSSNILIENNYIHRTNGVCTDPDKSCWAEMISMMGTNSSTVRYNTIDYNQTGEGIDFKDGSANGNVYGNVVTNTSSVGIYVDARGTISNINIYDNTVSTPNNFAIALANEDYYPLGGATIKGVNIYNNIIYNSNGIAIGDWGIAGNAGYIQDVNVVNNTIYNSSPSVQFYIDCAKAYSGVTVYVMNIVFRNNVLYNGSVQVCTDTGNPISYADHNGFNISGNSYGSSAVISNLLFVSPTTNFSLQSNSPMINAGSRVGAPTADIFGVVRNHGIDLGAYAYAP
jgi:hypothetical protein